MAQNKFDRLTQTLSNPNPNAMGQPLHPSLQLLQSTAGYYCNAFLCEYLASSEKATKENEKRLASILHYHT